MLIIIKPPFLKFHLTNYFINFNIQGKIGNKAQYLKQKGQKPFFCHTDLI